MESEAGSDESYSYDDRAMMIQVSVVFAVTCGLILRSFYTVCWEVKQAHVQLKQAPC